jgi:hypothetical protein
VILIKKKFHFRKYTKYSIKDTHYGSIVDTSETVDFAGLTLYTTSEKRKTNNKRR